MEIIHTDKAPAAVGPYSQAIKAGNTLYLSGQIAINPAEGKIVAKTIEEQADSLMAFLKNYDERKQILMERVEGTDGYLDEICNYWITGDYDSFASSAYWIAQIDKQPDLFKNRNERWLPKLQAAMNEAPTMFVFGAGHLIGDYGILQLLRNAGYNVEQIKIMQ